MVMRGGGYVPAPTDPAYYDMLAGGATEGIVEGISDVAKGAFGYVQGKNEKEEKKKIAQQLLQSFIEEGVPEQQAKTAVLEYVTKGTQELMKAYDNRRVLAAQLKQAEAQTAKTVEETAQIAPNAEASRGLVGAQTNLANTQASDIPIRTGILGEDTRSDNERANRDLDAKIDAATREYVAAHDADANGIFSAEERTKLIQATRKKLRTEWQKAKSATLSEVNSNPELKRMKDMTPEQLDAEALKLAKAEIEDYEFGMKNADAILPGSSQPSSTEPPATTTGGPTETAISKLKSVKFKPGVTPEQIMAAIEKDYPGADVMAVMKGIGQRGF